MKAYAMLVFPVLALGAATPKPQVPSLDPACLENITSIFDCVSDLKPTSTVGLADVVVCLSELVAGIQQCIPGLPGGLPSGLPTGLPTPLPADTPVVFLESLGFIKSLVANQQARRLSFTWRTD
ncbi:uncharacterized protein BKA55DRAFT_695661 [Fusarium redolens]|uniref:Hydrophobin n=1 Tax=Fusarium redolens TaxID=48865 RepID=A0A9P9G6S2_FUSRE|nr:uncharacterized protein BKA55DRAFT_695661 [Fusarium redolens]KAH7232237.1 hypothetical protein BKA55DRAFT_695661 [Fusarium redolens]